MRRASSALFAGLASTFVASLLAAPASADTNGLPIPFAYNYGDNETARTAAMGGATRAFASSATALYENPAGMVSARVYHIEAFGQITPEVNRQAYGGAIVDSVTGRLAGGLGVVGGLLDPQTLDRSFLDARLALAYPVADSFYLGMTGRYAKVTQSGLGPFGSSSPSGGLQDPEGGRSPFVDVVTFDAGMTLLLGDSVRLAAVGQNLSYPDNGILPTTFAGGVGFGTSELTVEVNALADFNSYDNTTGRFMAGGEYLMGGHVPLRMGYRYDQGADLHALSGGIGYIGTEFAIEGAVRRTLSDPGATTIVIGLAYFLESSGVTRSPQGFE